MIVFVCACVNVRINVISVVLICYLFGVNVLFLCVYFCVLRFALLLCVL